MKTKKLTVKYQGKIYRVIATSYMGRFDMFKLASQNCDGSPFGVMKDECKVL